MERSVDSEHLDSCFGEVCLGVVPKSERIKEQREQRNGGKKETAHLKIWAIQDSFLGQICKDYPLKRWVLSTDHVSSLCLGFQVCTQNDTEKLSSHFPGVASPFDLGFFSFWSEESKHQYHTSSTLLINIFIGLSVALERT